MSIPGPTHPGIYRIPPVGGQSSEQMWQDWRPLLMLLYSLAKVALPFESVASYAVQDTVLLLGGPPQGETGAPVAQAGLKLIMWPRATLNS